MVGGGGYESTVSQEKQDALSSDGPAHCDGPITPTPLKTDKSGRLLLETPADLENLLLLRKTKKEQRVAFRRPAASSAVHLVPYYVDEDDFWKACDQNQLLVIDKYLSMGGDVNARDTFNRTGLHRASTHGHTEVVTKLLEAGADIHSKDKLWSTCLHSACRAGHLPVLKLLLDHGAEIGALDKLDSTPLHVAVRTGHLDCVEHLIQCKADINTQDKEGDTPLHDAVHHNRLKIIELLLLHAADTSLTNQGGSRPLDGALEWQNDTRTLFTDQDNRK